jgi:hypothetical protein
MQLPSPEAARLADMMSSVPGGAEAAVAAAWAALLGRHARAEEVTLAVLKPEVGWLPLRVPLLRPPAERRSDDEEASSAVVPAAWHLTSRGLATAVAEGLWSSAGALASAKRGMTGPQLQALASRLGEEVNDDALEFGICFGGEKPGGVSLPLILLCGPLRPGKPLALSFRFSFGRLRPSTAERLLGHLVELLGEFGRKPEALIPHLKLARPPPSVCKDGPGVREYLEVQSWGDAFTHSIYEPGGGVQLQPVHASFFARAREAPEACALIDDANYAAGDGNDNSVGHSTLRAAVSVSFGELATRARRLAAALRSTGVGPDELVPLMAARGADMVCGIYGILEAGGAYVPLDTQWPDERVREVLEQCSAPAMLATYAYVGRLRKLGGAAPLLCIGEASAAPATGRASDATPAAGPRREANNSHMVYVFFHVRDHWPA